MRDVNLLGVGPTVRAEAARRRVTVLELSRRTGISRPTLTRRLDGDSAFTVDELQAVARVLDLPVTSLLVDTAA